MCSGSLNVKSFPVGEEEEADLSMVKMYRGLAESLPPCNLVPNWPRGCSRFKLLLPTKFWAKPTMVIIRETWKVNRDLTKQCYKNYRVLPYFTTSLQIKADNSIDHNKIYLIQREHMNDTMASSATSNQQAISDNVDPTRIISGVFSPLHGDTLTSQPLIQPAGRPSPLACRFS